MSNGQQLRLDEVAENIAWEENESELAIRLNLTLRDIPYGNGRLADVIALCTAVYLYADWGEGQQEIFRGMVWEWQHSQIHDDEIILTCYDLLFYLQKSKDFFYFSKGKSTRSIISNILSTWAITLGGYDGPNVAHEKITYKNKTIASMLNETLDEAKKLGGGKAFIRAVKGAVYVVAYGSNSPVYHFSADMNLIQTSDKFSMVNLVTRVVIMGKEDDEGRPSVETSISGRTEYGILQDIQTMGSLTLEEAKAKAEELLAQWEAGDATEDSFAQLAQENSADTSSASNGGLLQYVSPYSGYVDTFTQWSLDPSRQPGDTGIIQNTGSSVKGYHIMYFAGWDDPVWAVSAKNALNKEQYSQWAEKLASACTVTRGSGLKYVE